MSDRWTLSAIRSCNRERGHHWFDRKTMKFFNSRIERSVYQGPGGIFLVSSERFGETAPREFAVRKFNPRDCSVDTVRSVERTTSRASAIDAAKALARGR